MARDTREATTQAALVSGRRARNLLSLSPLYLSPLALSLDSHELGETVRLAREMAATPAISLEGIFFRLLYVSQAKR